MEDDEFDEPYRDRSDPDFVEDGERFDRPVPARRVTKIVRSIAAIVLAAMLTAAGTPISWVSVLTAILMFLIWIDLRSRDHDNTI